MSSSPTRCSATFALFLTLKTGSGILLLLAVSSYCFEPRQLLMTACWILIISFALVALTIIVQMERDELLSRITKTEPGKVALLDRGVLLRVLTWTILPILSLVAVQYPDVAGGMLSWIESIGR